jgi:hypothetical protein
MVPAALYAAPRREPVVQDQPRSRGALDDSPATATVPDDLAAALARNKRAAAAFAALDATNRYAVLHRLMTAKLPATRARRLATFVEMLAAGKTLHPRPKAKGKAKAKARRRHG